MIFPIFLNPYFWGHSFSVSSSTLQQQDILDTFHLIYTGRISKIYTQKYLKYLVVKMLHMWEFLHEQHPWCLRKISGIACSKTLRSHSTVIFISDLTCITIVDMMMHHGPWDHCYVYEWCRCILSKQKQFACSQRREEPPSSWMSQLNQPTSFCHDTDKP